MCIIEALCYWPVKSEEMVILSWCQYFILKTFHCQCWWICQHYCASYLLISHNGSFSSPPWKRNIQAKVCRRLVTRQLKRANLPAVTGPDCPKSSWSLGLIDKSQNTFYIKDVNSDESSVCVWWCVIHYQCILGDEGLCFPTSVLFIVSRCTFKHTRSLCCLCCVHSSDAYFTEAFEQSHCTKLM